MHKNRRVLLVIFTAFARGFFKVKNENFEGALGFLYKSSENIRVEKKPIKLYPKPSKILATGLISIFVCQPVRRRTGVLKTARIIGRMWLISIASKLWKLTLKIHLNWKMQTSNRLRKAIACIIVKASCFLCDILWSSLWWWPPSSTRAENYEQFYSLSGTCVWLSFLSRAIEIQDGRSYFFIEF